MLFFDEEPHMGFFSSSKRKQVQCCWVYHAKYVTDGSIDRYKAHLVAKSFSYVEGIDYSKTFSLVAKMNSIYLVLSLAASQGWTIFRWM